MAIVTYSQRYKVLMVKLTKAIKIKQSELRSTWWDKNRADIAVEEQLILIAQFSYLLFFAAFILFRFSLFPII